jgi:hypothetical protein
MQIDGLTKWIWVFAADPLLFEKMDAKKAGIISRGDFAHFIEGNPEYLLIFLIAKPDLLVRSKLEFDKDFPDADRQLTD